MKIFHFRFWETGKREAWQQNKRINTSLTNQEGQVVPPDLNDREHLTGKSRQISFLQ